MQQFASFVTEQAYQHIVKPVFFDHDPEHVHDRMTAFGEWLGHSRLAKKTLNNLYAVHDPRLAQTVAGIHFASPIGLAAGFDYEAKLTQIAAYLGFGFQTVGTITNYPYAGNPKPRLGRLPKSKSLMVNKGFKNNGAAATIHKLETFTFPIPVGISIGRTNSERLGQIESVWDIIRAFSLFESSSVRHAYYELNISCPNLYGQVDFYTPDHLRELMVEVDALRLTRPLFIKMPIEKSDAEVLRLLEVLSHHSPAGVIFGNLQKDRTNPALRVDEVNKYPRGNFSGKPTFDRSNQLISLTYAKYQKRFTIIGCGGVFSPADAYTKIQLGATIVQLITGMVFQGPQLIGQITKGLGSYIERDGFANLHSAIGSAHK